MSDRKRGRQPGQRIDSHVLSGTIGVTNLRWMVTQLVVAMTEPGLSASMKLTLLREVNKFRADIAKCRIEATRRKADALLAEPTKDLARQRAWRVNRSAVVRTRGLCRPIKLPPEYRWSFWNGGAMRSDRFPLSVLLDEGVGENYLCR
jgi:hypothetical protein